VPCQFQHGGRTCKPSCKATAGWLLTINDAIAAGADIQSGLSKVMEDKCVFIHGLKNHDVVRRAGVKQVENEIHHLTR